MQNKILLILALLFVSLTNAQTVTNKKEATKKGVYTTSTDKKAETEPVKAKATKQVAVNKSKSATKPKRKRTVINDDNETDVVIGPTENYLSVQMINNAMDFLGVHYRGGGTSRAGMDCSGMVTAVFDIFGMKLPRSSYEMAKVGEKIDLADAKKGDLIFFRTNGRGISHVGMVVENDGDEIKFIHSSTSKGVIISSTKEPYYKRTFVQANRVIM